MIRLTASAVVVGVLTLSGAKNVSAQTWGRESIPQNGVCFYEDANFGGRFFCVRAGTDVGVVPEGTNDEISSIRVFGNARVTVFADGGFEGESRRIDADVRDLGRMGWNDRISSFRVESRGFGGSNGSASGFWGRPSAPGTGACFYKDPDFEGDYFCARAGTTRAEMPRGMNDEISSIRVFGDAQVVVFRDVDFSGTSRLFEGDVRNLERVGWDDWISSFRVEPRGPARDRRGVGSRDDHGDSGRMTRQEAEAIVRRAYLAVLQREPDPGSRGFVDHVLNDKWTEQRLMDELRNSQEYRENHKR